VADRQTLRRMSANARTFARLDAAERIVRSLERWAQGRGAVQETPAGNGGGR
jgi:UDP-N-acetylglucosamine:LPS N-acetylglucosamine transferase